MTIGAWIVVIVISACLILIGLCVGGEVSRDDTKGMVIGALIGLVLSIILGIGVRWFYQNTESGARALKTQDSNFNKGIERKVSVYDVQGDLIQEYKGKFDLEYDDDRILFDDENGLRHIIYYPTGTVIVDEINK